MGNAALGRSLLLFAVVASVPAMPAAKGEASWEASGHVGFDSNVNLSVDDPQGDGYFGGAVVFQRDPSYESRLDWSLESSLTGSVFAETEDLAYAAVGLAPGLVCLPHPLWTLNVSPFAEAKVVRDRDQSAFSYGIAVNLEERISGRWYAGQSYVYRVSRAEVETYSFSEHVLDLFVGAGWTERLSSEVGYAYSRGDSFRTVGTASGESVRRGRHRRYSDTFGGEVVREKVDRHAATVRFGIGWTGSLFSQVSYEFAVLNGDLGSAESHNVFFATGLRF